MVKHFSTVIFTFFIHLGDMALLISRFYVRSNKYRNDVFGLSQSMFANHLEMIVERGFPLLRRINEIISTLRDMGIMSKLSQDFHYNMSILTSIREMKSHKNQQELELADLSNVDDDQKKEEENPDIVLTTAHLEGAFTILIMGLFVSSVMFILEIIFNSKFVRKLFKLIREKFSERAEAKN